MSKASVGLIWVAIGAGLGFLSIESGGLLLLFTFIPIAIVLRRHEPQRVPAVLVLFGGGYLVTVATWWMAEGSGNVGYFVFHVAIGVAFIACGLLMGIRDRAKIPATLR